MRLLVRKRAISPVVATTARAVCAGCLHERKHRLHLRPTDMCDGLGGCNTGSDTGSDTASNTGRLQWIREQTEARASDPSCPSEADLRIVAADHDDVKLEAPPLLGAVGVQHFEPAPLRSLDEIVAQSLACGNLLASSVDTREDARLCTATAAKHRERRVRCSLCGVRCAQARWALRVRKGSHRE